MPNQIPRRVIWAVVATGLLSFSGVVVETAMNITYPTLTQTYQLPLSTIQWLTTGYMLVVAILVPISAFLNRRFAMRTLFTVANLSFLAGLILAASAANFWWLFLGRLIQGAGAGIALPLMFNIILTNVPKQKLGLMMGLGTMVTAIAPAIGPTFGGFMLTHGSWRLIFLPLLPLVVLSLLVGSWAINFAHHKSAQLFDWLGFLWLSLGFSGLLLGFSLTGQLGWLAIPVIISFVVAIISLGIFVRHSLHFQHPLIDLHVFMQRRFSQHVLAYLLLNMTPLGMSLLIPTIIQEIDHQSALLAGLTSLPGAIIGAALAPLSGALLDRLGPRRPILWGISSTFIALAFLVIAHNQLTMPVLTGLYFFVMLGLGLAFGNLMTNGINQLDTGLAATGNAVFTTTMQLSGGLGTSITASLIDSGSTISIGVWHALITLALFAFISGSIAWRATSAK